MKILKLGSALALSLCLSASAFAASAQQGQTMDLAGIKAKCSELLQNEQLKPFKAIVSCKQVLTQWRPAAAQADALQVANSKEIGASFNLKGYEVPFKSESMEMPSTPASCTTLEQVRTTIPAVDIELSCAALDSVQSVADICAPAIDERIEADPSIQIVELTGHTFNSCTGH